MIMLYAKPQSKFSGLYAWNLNQISQDTPAVLEDGVSHFNLLVSFENNQFLFPFALLQGGKKLPS